MNNNLPAGRDEKQIQEIIKHYENQTDEEALYEDEYVIENEKETFISVPCELLPKIREIIASHEMMKKTA